MKALPSSLSPALKPPPQAILFDWDDTLFDHQPLIPNMMERIISTHAPGSGLTPDQFYQEWKKDQDGACLTHFKTDFRGFGQIWDEFYHDVPFENLSLLPGAQEILDKLKEKGIRLGIVSNKPRKYLERELKHFGLEAYFEVVIGQHEDEDKRKPSDYTVNEAIRTMGIQPERVWFVGDTLEDMQASRQLQRIHIHHSDERHQLIRSHTNFEDKARPIISLRNLKEFMAYVDIIPSQNNPAIAL